MYTPCHPKVGDLGAIESVEQHVGRLEVAVNDGGVQVEQAHADVLADPAETTKARYAQHQGWMGRKSSLDLWYHQL